MKKFKKIVQIISDFFCKYCYLFAPIITGIIFLIICKMNNLFPIGDRSIAWCDMEQQVIPLLNQFKDVLEGKQSFQYSHGMAGGMSFFSVFFFFLSNPFSFLVVFVNKSDMMSFVNILLMLKMMVISLTSCWYFKKRYTKLPVLFAIAFSLLYTYSTYNLMYYQNIMWMDLVYMFPLLLYGIDKLIDDRKPYLYIICISICVLFNYYIGAMIVFFTLIYIGLRYLFDKRDDKNKSYSLFTMASIIACLLVCVTIIPSFLQYLSSARSVGFVESLKKSWFVTSYQTTIPLILSIVFLIPFFFLNGMAPKKRIYAILIILFSIPLIIDPINKAWHLGSYQAFPCRFAFMLIFLCIDLIAINLNVEEETKWNKMQWIWLILCIAALVVVYMLQSNYVNSKITDLDNYATSLWGNTTSFEALLRYYSVILIVGIVIYLLYRSKVINLKIVSVAFVGLAVVDISFATRVYMVVPSRSVQNYQNIYDLADKIEDDGFYRVKTSSKIFDVNTLGGLGYNNLAHYTSLTSKDHLYTMKKLGYSSYWMEVGAYGGTSFVDSLMINKYTIMHGKNSNSIYSNDYYSIVQNDVYPLGIVTSSNLSKETELKEDERPLMQDYIYQNLFNTGDKLHHIYQYTSVKDLIDNSDEKVYKFNIDNSNYGSVIYEVDIKGTQKVYFECFDEYSNSLGEHINDSLRVYLNNSLVSNSYPSQSNNGSLYLGEFSNCHIKVRVDVKKNIYCSSFNVYGIDNMVLKQSIDNCLSPNLKVSSKAIYGNYHSDSGDNYLFLPISYSSSLHAKVNNSETEVYRVYSDFAAIKLAKGDNDIKLYYIQSGANLGSIATGIGAILFGLFYYFKDKLLKNEKFNKVVSIVLLCVCAVVVLVLYVAPIIINIYGQLLL